MSPPNCWSRSSIGMDGRSNPTLPITLSVAETCLFRLPHPSNHRGEEHSIKEREWLWFRGMDSAGMAGRPCLVHPGKQWPRKGWMSSGPLSLSLSPLMVDVAVVITLLHLSQFYTRFSHCCRLPLSLYPCSSPNHPGKNPLGESTHIVIHSHLPDTLKKPYSQAPIMEE